MKQTVAYLFFSLFISFTVCTATFGLWGDLEKVASITFAEEEEEEEAPSSAEEKQEYIYTYFFKPSVQNDFLSNESNVFTGLSTAYEDVYLQTVFTPPDELLA